MMSRPVAYLVCLLCFTTLLIGCAAATGEDKGVAKERLIAPQNSERIADPQTLAEYATHIDLKEIKRTTNPTGGLDVSLLAADGGATTSTAYHVNIVPAGSPVEYSIEETRCFVVDKCEASDIALEWTGDFELTISLSQGRTFLKLPALKVGQPGAEKSIAIKYN